jgi:sterol desaturase/sphingolipid hydroxylase (fatty acid hydroxylase superfamily)
MFSYRNFWRGRKYHLDKMTLRELVLIFYQYPAILAYHVLAIGALVAFFAAGGPDWTTPLFVVAGIATFSLSWYLLHRFLLHSTILYRFRWTAPLWKRVHFDHHSDPNDLRVLFGAISTTLPPMVAISVGAWMLTHNQSQTLVFFATLVLMTIWNEFCHCIQHLGITPKNRFLRRIKKLHLIHHFKNETVYYGITNFFWDRFLGTFPGDASSIPPSPTVFNLGYSGDVEQRYPWVGELSSRAPVTNA